MSLPFRSQGGTVRFEDRGVSVGEDVDAVVVCTDLLPRLDVTFQTPPPPTRLCGCVAVSGWRGGSGRSGWRGVESYSAAHTETIGGRVWEVGDRQRASFLGGGGGRRVGLLFLPASGAAVG